jgi:PTH1 family peptidyl-tRNA hydrolase
MKLIVGLGNPGPQYTSTRHNAGFMVIDRLCAAHGGGAPIKARFQAATTEGSIGGEKCLFMKPTTFMNLSGRSVAEAVRFFKADPVEDLLVVVDDLYLPVGAVRLKPGGGAAGHNGLSNIELLLARDDYPRLRVGVGQQPGGGKPAVMEQSDFVLSRFTQDEEPLLASAITKSVKAAETFVSRGLTHAMNFANAGTPPRPNAPRPPTPKVDGTEGGGKPDEPRSRASLN